MTALTICLAGAAAIAAVIAVVALVALRSARRDAAVEAAALRARLDAVERTLRAPVREPVDPPQPEYVITRVGELPALPQEPLVPARLPAPAFADAVLRETVVQAASLVQGVRRALAPETRNRIRFEIEREVKRSRKARKAEVKEALREYRARRRSEVVGAPDVPRIPGEGAA